jgi:hypothetical protein
VKALNVVKYIRFGHIHYAINLPVRTLPFEHPKETLTGRIIAAVTNSTHGADQRVLIQETLIVTTAKLAATV